MLGGLSISDVLGRRAENGGFSTKEAPALQDGRRTHLVLGKAWSKTQKEGMRRQGKMWCAPFPTLRLGWGTAGW